MTGRPSTSRPRASTRRPRASTSRPRASTWPVRGGLAVAVLLRVLGGAALVLLGAVVGLLGGFHHSSLRAGLPVGLVLALVALVLAQVVATGLTARGPGRGPGRFPGTGAGLVSAGWVVCVVVVSTGRSAGDVVVASDGRGTAFFWGGLLLSLVGPLVATGLGSAPPRAPDPLQGPRAPGR